MLVALSEVLGALFAADDQADRRAGPAPGWTADLAAAQPPSPAGVAAPRVARPPAV